MYSFEKVTKNLWGMTLTLIMLCVIATFLIGCNSGGRPTRPVGSDSTDQDTSLSETDEPGLTTLPTATVTLSPTAEPESQVQSHLPIPSAPTFPQPVEFVRLDLAEQLGIALDDIEVVQLEEVIWPDTCLGLPAPELCAPGATPGYRVTLMALGQEYTYHTDKGETFRFAGPGDIPRPPLDVDASMSTPSEA
jgi:hypothetical protein